jgi:hypothetical protein
MNACIRHGLRLGVAVWVVMAWSWTGASWSGGVVHTADERVVFHIQSDQIDESSSLVVSTVHPHLVYTTNDSGDAPNVYVLDSRTGALVGTTTLEGVEPVDVEALAAGDDGSLVIADIGDNDAVRDAVDVYRIPQPGRGTASVQPAGASLTYQGGPRDAEGVLYDAQSGRVFVVSKEYAEAHVYRSPRDLFDRQHAVMTPVADAPDLATDATFLPGGELVAIRTYFAVDYYRLPGWERVATEVLPLQKQGEAIAAPPGGRELWIGSEGVNSAVLAIPVPTSELEPSAPPTTTTASPPVRSADDEHREKLLNRAVVVGGAAGVLFVLVLIVGVVRYIRHRPDH